MKEPCNPQLVRDELIQLGLLHGVIRVVVSMFRGRLRMPRKRTRRKTTIRRSGLKIGQEAAHVVRFNGGTLPETVGNEQAPLRGRLVSWARMAAIIHFQRPS